MAFSQDANGEKYIHYCPCSRNSFKKVNRFKKVCMENADFSMALVEFWLKATADLLQDSGV